jgi:hypothetical protein
MSTRRRSRRRIRCKAKVYLDKIQICDGQRFDLNFANGLASSKVFAPVMTGSCLRSFVELAQADIEDFVLTEWPMALELQQRGVVKAIFPIIIGEQGTDGRFAQDFFDNLRNDRVCWPALEATVWVVGRYQI